MMMWVHAALATAVKPISQGEAATQSPATRLIHSSHSSSRIKAASAMAAMTAPPMMAVQVGVEPRRAGPGPTEGLAAQSPAALAEFRRNGWGARTLRPSDRLAGGCADPIAAGRFWLA